MSRLYLALFWLAGLLALATSVEYQCFVNRLIGPKASQNTSNELRKNGNDENQIISRPSTVENATANKESGGPHKNTEESETDRTADAEESMAIATWIGSAFTGVALIGLLYTFHLTRKQTEKFEEANRVMRETHDVERRPWLSATFKYIGPPAPYCMRDGILVPREHEQSKIVAHKFCFVVEVENHGPSPAANVTFRVSMALNVGLPKDVAKEWCNRIRTFIQDDVVVFPSQKKILNSERFVWDKDIESILSAPNVSGVFPVAFGCVNYESPHIRETGQTRFGWMMGEVNEGRVRPGIFKDGLDLMTKPIAFYREVLNEAD